MRSRFNPFSSHLELAPLLWQKLIRSDSLVVDMTAGNGKDTAVLKSFNPGRLIAIDIQETAILKAKTNVEGVEFHVADHSQFPDRLEEGSVTIAVYNLGYLPGGDKSLTTELKSTLLSVQKMLSKLEKGGALSITCYPGHNEGAEEEKELLEFARSLNPLEFMVFHTRFINRNQSPSLLWISKAT